VNKKASNDSRFIAIQDLVDLEKIDSRWKLSFRFCLKMNRGEINSLLLNFIKNKIDSNLLLTLQFL
jgi:hypothetical protein